MPFEYAPKGDIASLMAPEDDDFDAAVASFGRWTLVATTSGTIAVRSGEDNHPGIWSLLPTTLANSGYTVRRDVASRVLPGATGWIDVQWVFRVPVRATATEDWTTRIGFTDNNAAAPVDGVWLHSDASSAFWQLGVALASVQTLTVTTVAVDTAWHSLRICGNTAVGWTFLLDGVVLGTVDGALVAANLTGVSAAIRRGAGVIWLETPRLDLDAFRLRGRLSRRAA